ncbi:hypothetical protein GCM10023231_07890 [Olivibacter ginsenosidimutans]|uniref:DUF4153 domain-containing protein n=1 Tax=Olivibacter ginsenosidimutans TaxID=1176537 RepID=A0ABP9AN38_9SPHI
MFIGLAIALFAVDHLFSLDLREKYYQNLFFILGIGFNTLFFLAGVPTQIPSLAKYADYPKGLKIFTQYVLIPLMGIYLLILLSYELKIIIDWELPKGIVSNLIIGYAFFGILSLLLIFPIRSQEGHTWIQLFSRFFYFTMVPLLVLLGLATYKRINYYGITELRYFLLVLACWLTFITVYFLVSKGQHIKLIPLSLCLCTLFAIYGPQSASSISKNSQIARLKRLMPQSDRAANMEKGSIIRYLVNHHGLTALQSFTKRDLTALEHHFNQENDTLASYMLDKQKLDTAFALLSVDPNQSYQNTKSYSVSTSNAGVTDVKGWNYLVLLDNYQRERKVMIGKDSMTITMGDDNRHLDIQIGKNHMAIKLDSIIGAIDKAYEHKQLVSQKGGENHYYYPQEKMQFMKTIGSYTIGVFVTDITIYSYFTHSKETTNSSFRATILLK